MGKLSPRLALETFSFIIESLSSKTVRTVTPTILNGRDRDIVSYIGGSTKLRKRYRANRQEDYAEIVNRLCENWPDTQARYTTWKLYRYIY